MKRKLSVFLGVILMFAFVGTSFTACTPRNEILKIYNWEYYIDESIFEEFEEEYFEATGKKVTVKQSTFSENEKMYSQISSKKDYDLVCPSDYTIEKMIENELLIELDWDLIENGSNIDPVYRSAEYAAYDPSLKYTVPYLAGTFGIMYDPSRGVDRADITTWGALWNSKYSQKITMKDSMRDTVAVGNIYANLDALKQSAITNGYNETFRNDLSKAINRFTPANFSQPELDKTKAALNAQKPLVLKYEDDHGIDDKIAEIGNGILGLYWSCDAGYAMSENKNLEYYVPDEGSNFWVDGFVIPKYAKNVEAAHAFLNFICRPDIAARNMAESGGCSVIADAVETYKAELEEDTAFFSGKSVEWRQMYLDTLFLGGDVLERCAMMRNFGANESAVLSMWNTIAFS